MTVGAFIEIRGAFRLAVSDMKLWACIIYTVAHACVCIAGAAFSTRIESKIRQVGPEDRGSSFQTFLRFCLYGMPACVTGSVCCVWLSYVCEWDGGYVIGASPAAIVVAAVLAWHCVAHDASPDVRHGTHVPRPRPVITAYQ